MSQTNEPAIGQNWRHAVRQYQNDHDPRAHLLVFQRRVLVYFAVDPDDIHMATCLSGLNTRFCLLTGAVIRVKPSATQEIPCIIQVLLELW